MTKRNVYLFCFSVLGLLLGFVIHALVEVWYIKLLLSNFQKYNLGLSWYDLEALHYAVLLLLLPFMTWWGYKQGERWWHVLYVEKRWKKDLKKDF